MTVLFHWLAGAAVLAATSACTAVGEDDAVPTTQDIVTKDVFQRAFATLDRVDYLPFEYTADGCYARAFYMSMELASQSIESNAVFALQRHGVDGAPDGPQPMFGPSAWGFHTAPLLEVGTPDRAEPFVVDPAIGHTPFKLDD